MAVEIQKLTPENLDGVSSILILCWGLLGDVFIRVPLIEAVRKRFPKARIVVVVDPVAVAVLENHPDCDEVVSFSRVKRPAFHYLVETSKKLVALRRRKFGLCINLYSGGSTPRFSKFINANIRLGFNHTRGLRRANNVVVPRPSFAGNWTKALGTMLEPLGIDSKDIRRGTSFYCSKAAVDRAKLYLMDVSAKLVGINLGAGSDEKRWPVRNFVSLAKRIYAKYGIIPLVFTNPGTEYLATEFEVQYGKHSQVIVVPVTPLDDVAALMSNCGYFITADTSLMHMAFGLKVPTLVLFTFTRPEMVAPEDVRFSSCFVESKSGRDYCGQPAGSVDISVNAAMQQFEQLAGLE